MNDDDDDDDDVDYDKKLLQNVNTCQLSRHYNYLLSLFSSNKLLATSYSKYRE